MRGENVHIERKKITSRKIFESVSGLIFFVLALAQLTLSIECVAQPTNSSELIVHLDKSDYFIGETIWYKIYKTGVKEAKTFYLELYDIEGRRVVVHKHFVENNMSFGNLILPNTLSTGRYALVLSEERSHVGFRKEVLIINPQEDKTMLSEVSFGGSDDGNYGQGDWNIKFTGPDGAIDRRERIDMSILVKDVSGKPVNGNFSIAVKDISKLIPVSKIQSSDRTVQTAESHDSMVIKGRALSENGMDISERTPLMLQLIIGNSAHSVITDKNGEFEIPIDRELLGTNQVYFMNYKHFSKTGIPLRLEFMTEKPAVVPGFEETDKILDLSDVAKQYLEKQVALSSFFASGKQVYSPITYQELELGIRVDHEPDRLIIPDYYETLPTMQEVFRELLGTVRVRNTEDGFRISIRHQDLESVIKHDPLMLVDGQPETDLDKILALNPRDLEKIEVFFDKEKIIQFGITGSNGILSITTKKNDYVTESVPSYEVQGFTRTSNFIIPDFTGSLKDNPTPDLRTLLYWNPSIGANENGEISFEFFNSDSLGDLEIEIFGKTSGGRIISKKTTIKGRNSL